MKGRLNKNRHGAKHPAEATFLARALNLPGVRKVVMGPVKVRRHGQTTGTLQVRGIEGTSVRVSLYVPGAERCIYLCTEHDADPQGLMDALAAAAGRR